MRQIRAPRSTAVVIAVLMLGTAWAAGPTPAPTPAGFVDGRPLLRATTPLPPPRILAPAADPVTAKRASAVVLSEVPAFDWCFGCAATSAAMMAGYYDRNGYPNMYAGPAGDGVCPLTNSVWGPGRSPLSATEMGYDGRAEYGHVDDYWIGYGSTAQDPYLSGGWPQHPHADCTADFMKTNQSAYGNGDGSTALYLFGDGSPYSGPGELERDGLYGLHLFFESRGYVVESFFTQLIRGYAGNTAGFTFSEYVQEIDAGRPVLIHVEGHTMLGYGYDTVGSLIWLHDTWDHSGHTMAWGGGYPYDRDQLAHWGVSCVRLASPNAIFRDGFETADTSGWTAP